ncbi:carboxypeptidase-like regulatory domain-containing protein [Spirosoma lituiforme]
MAQGSQGGMTDMSTESASPGATVIIVDTKTGVTADANGVYTVNVSPGSYTLRVSFVGFNTKNVPVTVSATGTEVVDVSLLPKPLV